MGHLSFWIVVLGVPLAVVLGNGFLRHIHGIPQSTAADLMLALIVFDAAVIIQHHEFQEYVRSEWLKANIIAIYVLLLIVNYVLWHVSAFKLEVALLSRYSVRQRRYLQTPAWLIFGAFMMTVFALASNTLVFAYGD
jgi:hypothetical protein